MLVSGGMHKLRSAKNAVIDAPDVITTRLQNMLEYQTAVSLHQSEPSGLESRHMSRPCQGFSATAEIDLAAMVISHFDTAQVQH
jgi:hypothetical protein